MRLISIADRDFHPLTDSDPGVKLERYGADSFKWDERDEREEHRVTPKPLERTFLKAKRRNPPK